MYGIVRWFYNCDEAIRCGIDKRERQQKSQDAIDGVVQKQLWPVDLMWACCSEKKA
jgi:hypothetical protein